MKLLSPVMRDRAVDALAYVQQQDSLHAACSEIVTGLIQRHGATLRHARGVLIFRCAGVVVRSAAHSNSYLLGSWQRSANLRLSNLKLENFDD